MVQILSKVPEKKGQLHIVQRRILTTKHRDIYALVILYTVHLQFMFYITNDIQHRNVIK